MASVAIIFRTRAERYADEAARIITGGLLKPYFSPVLAQALSSNGKFDFDQIKTILWDLDHVYGEDEQDNPGTRRRFAAQLLRLAASYAAS